MIDVIGGLLQRKALSYSADSFMCTCCDSSKAMYAAILVRSILNIKMPFIGRDVPIFKIRMHFGDNLLRLRHHLNSLNTQSPSVLYPPTQRYK